MMPTELLSPGVFQMLAALLVPLIAAGLWRNVYMAGIPVVAARSGGIPSVITDGENGLLFSPDDPAELTHALVALAGDPGLRRRLIANGRRTASERFDWQHIVDAHEDAFVGALQQAGVVS